MVEAPEKIWLSAPDDVWFDPDEGKTEYLRADLAERQIAELRADVKFFREQFDDQVKSREEAEADKARLSEALDHYRSGLQVLASTFYKEDQHQDYASHVLNTAPRAALSGSGAGGWRPIETAPKDGSRILLVWKPVGGLSEHVELGKWKDRQGWSNTYGHAFSGDPDAWARLAPFPTAPTGDHHD